MCFKAAKPTITKRKQRCTTLHEGKKRRLRCSFTARVNTRSRQPSMISRTNVPSRSKTASKPGNRISYTTVITTSCTVRKKTQMVCVLLRRNAAKNILRVVPVPQLGVLGRRVVYFACVRVCVCFFLAFCPMWKGWQFFLLVWPFQTISGIGKFYRPSFSSKRLKIQNMALIACKGEWSFLLLLVHVVANWQLYSRFKFLFSYTLLYIARYCNARGGKPIICTYLVCNKNKVVPFLFLSQDVVEKQTIWFEKGATKTTFAVLPILTGSQLLIK